MSETKKRQRIFWRFIVIVIVVVFVVPIVGLVFFRYSSRDYLYPFDVLAHVVQVERNGVDESVVQGLGWDLAILGRDDEVRQLDFTPKFEAIKSKVRNAQLELVVVPWREGMQEIAGNHRLVMIMEDHFVSEHREWIGGTLETFASAGFTHYAAEAIRQSDSSLTRRGFPSCKTGFYVSDPKFGNTIRRALALNFEVVGYDFEKSTQDAREEFAANELARIIKSDPQAKLVVHAGLAHVLKAKTGHDGFRWMASRLWEKTDIEPFTIWQWSSLEDTNDYKRIVQKLEELGEIDESILLMPPPSSDLGFQDPPYGLASVDAIVIHPPYKGVSPERRTVLFPGEMSRVAGVWTGDRWPVVVSAYRQGEPVDAVPLDQVMLRLSEKEFVLWVPKEYQHEIRVFDIRGQLDSVTHEEKNTLVVDLVK